MVVVIFAWSHRYRVARIWHAHLVVHSSLNWAMVGVCGLRHTSAQTCGHRAGRRSSPQTYTNSKSGHTPRRRATANSNRRAALCTRSSCPPLNRKQTQRSGLCQARWCADRSFHVELGTPPNSALWRTTRLPSDEAHCAAKRTQEREPSIVELARTRRDPRRTRRQARCFGTMELEPTTRSASNVEGIAFGAPRQRRAKLVSW